MLTVFKYNHNVTFQPNPYFNTVIIYILHHSFTLNKIFFNLIIKTSHFLNFWCISS